MPHLTVRLTLAAAALAGAAACVHTTPAPESPAPSAAAAAPADVESYLASYDSTYRRLYTVDQEAQWASNTHIVEGDTTTAARTKAADQALADFVGSTENIARIRGFLAHRESLTPLQVRRLETMLYNAGNSPPSSGSASPPRRPSPRRSTATPSPSTARRSRPIRSTPSSASRPTR